MTPNARRTAALKRKAKPIVGEWVEKHLPHGCMACGGMNCMAEVHHVARGIHRQAALLEPCTWLLICSDCHEDMGNMGAWPLVRQLAVKLCRDAANFDLERFNTLRGRDPNAITMEDVAQWLRVR